MVADIQIFRILSQNPERKNIDKLKQEDLDETEEDLNNRARKRLGLKAPVEPYQLEIDNILLNVALESRI